MTYLHVIQRGVLGVRSPADRLYVDTREAGVYPGCFVYLGAPDNLGNRGGASTGANQGADRQVEAD